MESRLWLAGLSAPLSFYTLVLKCLLIAPAFAEIIVDDTLADGTRTDADLPNESAWQKSSSDNLSVVPGTTMATISGGGRPEP